MDDAATIMPLPAAGACHRDAHALLARWGHQPSRIIQVNPDSILFVAVGGRPRTAWITREGPPANQVKVRVVNGFPAYDEGTL